MDALLLAVLDEFGGGVVGVEFYLVDGGDDLKGRVVEEYFEVFDAEVGDADVADFAGGRELLEVLPMGVVSRMWISLTSKRRMGLTMF